MPQVWQASLAAQAEVVADDLGAPARPHIVVAANGLSLSHEAKVKGGTNEISLKGQVHAAHGIKRSLKTDGHVYMSVMNVFVRFT